MNRKTFIKKMREQGFKLDRDGHQWWLKKEIEGDREIVLFLKKDGWRSSEDNFKTIHTREYVDIRVWPKNKSGGRSLIGGKFDFMPFNLVEEYLEFYNKLYKALSR